VYVTGTEGEVVGHLVGFDQLEVGGRMNQLCPDCRSHHTGDCPAQPKITFSKCQNREAFDSVVSRDNTIRFRTIKKNGVTVIDGDWFHLPWCLTKPAIDKIFDYCNERAMSCGGGESTLRVRVKAKWADEVAAFVSKTVSSPGAWEPLSAARPRYVKDTASNLTLQENFDESDEAA